MLPDLDLFSLKAFLAVSEEGSLAGAARRLLLSEPAVSVRIRVLEEHLGFSLFERSNRGVHLTPAGRLLADGMTAILEQLESAVRDAREAAARSPQRIVLWCRPNTQGRLLPGLVTRLEEAEPDIELAVVVKNPDDVLIDLARGNLDCAVVPNAKPLHRPLVSTPLIHDVVGLVLGVNHPLADKARINPSDLRQYRLLCHDRMGGFQPQLEAALKRCDLKLSTLSIGSVGGIKALIKQQFALTFFPQLAVLEDLASGDLLFRPVALSGGRRISQVTWFCFPERHPLAPKLTLIRDILAESAKEFQAQLDAALTESRRVLLNDKRPKHGQLAKEEPASAAL